MNSLSVRPPATRLPPMNILIFAGLFWFFTYAALSVRTELILGDQFNLFTVRRILGTTVGALAFGLVLTCIARRARDSKRSSNSPSDRGCSRWSRSASPRSACIV